MAIFDTRRAFDPAEEQLDTPSHSGLQNTRWKNGGQVVAARVQGDGFFVGIDVAATDAIRQVESALDAGFIPAPGGTDLAERRENGNAGVFQIAKIGPHHDGSPTRTVRADATDVPDKKRQRRGAPGMAEGLRDRESLGVGLMGE